MTSAGATLPDVKAVEGAIVHYVPHGETLCLDAIIDAAFGNRADLMVLRDGVAFRVSDVPQLVVEGARGTWHWPGHDEGETQ